MKKAIILTRSPIKDFEKEIINKTSCFKIAVNEANFKTNFRIFHDSSHFEWYLKNYTEPLITNNLHLAEIKKNKQLHRFFLIYDSTSNVNDNNINNLFINYGTLSPAISFVKKIGFEEVLLVAMNNAYYKQAQDGIKETVKIFSKFIKFYKYDINSNIDIEYKSIKDFCNE